MATIRNFGIVLALLLTVTALCLWSPGSQARAVEYQLAAEQTRAERARVDVEVRATRVLATRVLWYTLAGLAGCMFILAVSITARHVKGTLLLPAMTALPDKAVLLSTGRVFDARAGSSQALAADSPGDLARLEIVTSKAAQVAAALTGNARERQRILEVLNEQSY
jgi:hypothetical protein